MFDKTLAKWAAFARLCCGLWQNTTPRYSARGHSLHTDVRKRELSPPPVGRHPKKIRPRYAEPVTKSPANGADTRDPSRKAAILCAWFGLDIRQPHATRFRYPATAYRSTSSTMLHTWFGYGGGTRISFGFGTKRASKSHERRLWHGLPHFVRFWQCPINHRKPMNWCFPNMLEAGVSIASESPAKTVARAIRRPKSCQSRRKCMLPCQSRTKCDCPVEVVHPSMGANPPNKDNKGRNKGGEGSSEGKGKQRGKNDLILSRAFMRLDYDCSEWNQARRIFSSPFSRSGHAANTLKWL